MITNRDKLNNLPTEDFVDAILGRMLTSNGVTGCELDLDLIKQDLVMWLNMEVVDGNK